MENNSIEKSTTKSVVTVSRVYKAHYQKSGTLTAEMKQIVDEITLYPDKTIRDNLQGNVYDLCEYDQEKKEFKKTRTDVTLIDVPDGQTLDSVSARLSSYPNATLYRILSNHPIMSETTEKYYQGLIDSDQEALAMQIKNRIANGQILRYHTSDEEKGIFKDDLILDKFGKPQYKACFLDETGKKEDTDLRTEDPTDYYTTIEVLMSMNNLTFGHGQSL